MPTLFVPLKHSVCIILEQNIHTADVTSITTECLKCHMKPALALPFCYAFVSSFYAFTSTECTQFNFTATDYISMNPPTGFFLKEATDKGFMDLPCQATLHYYAFYSSP